MKQLTQIPILPKRTSQAHKGDFGKILVIAGSRGMTGAAILAGEAALLSGAGLVTVATPLSEQPIVAAKITPAAMTYGLPSTLAGTLSEKAEEEILKLCSLHDVVAIGPGLSQNAKTQALLKKVIPQISQPLVMDADALNAFQADLGALKKRSQITILTPHPGEFSRLINQPIPTIEQDALRLASDFCQDKNAVTLVLKVAPSLVVDSKNYYINTTGNPGMATAGSGDVLTGMIAALLGQKLSPFAAASLGVYLHGLAGDQAAEKKGMISMIASDILFEIPAAFTKKIDI